MNTRERVAIIFRDVFDDDKLQVKDSTCAADIEDWDSLAQINLLVAMEKEFRIKLNLSEVKDLKNVGDMISVIEKKLAA